MSDAGTGKPLFVPRSARTGIAWPALPGSRDAVVLALYHQLDGSQWWPPDVLLQAQLRQAELLLSHASRTVPFYRERLAGLAGIRRGGLDMEAWRRIALLKRADLQEDTDALLSRALPKDHAPLGEVSSSGSTGAPVSVRTTAVTGTFFQALNLRYHLWFERDFSAKVANLRIPEYIDGGDGDDKPRGWVPGHASGPINSFSLTRTVGEQLDWLLAENPDYILTYPTNLRALAAHCRETGISLPRLRGASTMGETFDQEVRSLCREVWGIDVSDAYSAQEVGMIALQCPGHTHYHVQAESLLVEVLDGADRPCALGQAGRLVITDLHNFAMPLIRYEIGDHAVAGGACPCGRGLPVLERILGRTRNMLTLPSGEQFWPNISGAMFTAVAPVRQFQMTQTGQNEIEVKVVVEPPLSAAQEDRLVASLHSRFGHPFAFRFTHVDDIPRSASGKFEDFVSAIA